MSDQIFRVLRMQPAAENQYSNGLKWAGKSIILPDNFPDEVFITRFAITVEGAEFWESHFGNNRFSAMVDPRGEFSKLADFPQTESAPYENLCNLHVSPIAPGLSRLPPATEHFHPVRLKRSNGDRLVIAASPLSDNSAYRLILRMGFLRPEGYEPPPIGNMIDAYTMFALGNGAVAKDVSFLGIGSPHSFSMTGAATMSNAWDPFNAGGYSLSLNGTGGISIPHNIDFSPNDGEFTWELRFKTASLGATQTLFTKRDGTNPGIPYHLFIDASGTIKASMSSNGTTQDIANNIPCGVVAANAEYAFEINRAVNTFSSFLNGVKTAEWTVSAGTAIHENNHPIMIGHQDIGYGFVGAMAAVRFSKDIPRHRANYTPATEFFH